MANESGNSLSILWFRRDLRLGDNPAVDAAARRDAATLPLFIDDDSATPVGGRPTGGASRWWRGESLRALDASLHVRGSHLVVRRGSAVSVLDALLRETGADRVIMNLRRDPAGATEDAAIAAHLRARSVTIDLFDANYLHDPHHLRTGSGGGFKVFTPFWNRLREMYQPPRTLPAPRSLRAPAQWPRGIPLDELRVTDAWAAPIAKAWQPGEAGARARLETFADEGVAHYATMRDRPDVDGTSRLSPHLAWGEISVHEIWRHLTRSANEKALPFLREIAWRDFNMHLLQSFPELSWKPMQDKFAAFPAKKDKTRLAAWRRGATGYPIVDAGLRQLWQTGWMHNRVRMIVGSFLVKDLLLPWQQGEEWFWDTLVDADIAQNGGNWQWVAGCGADAAPFFRIFNPVLQGEKFDPKGTYVREWVPELSRLPNKLIHQPWTAGAAQLADAGVELGKTYPHPIVDHGAARKIALAAYKRISGESGAESEFPALL